MPAIPAFVFLGLFDGLNVCSISLLVLFVSVLYTLNTTRKQVLFLGGIYIASIYASYFLVGLGIMLVSISLPAIPHIIARISVAIMLFFGIANVLNYFRPGTLPTSFAVSFGSRIVNYFRGATLASAVIGGSLVGLHNLPCACTGGIYPAFIALISSADFRLGYLALYNLVFVVPLVSILVVCTNKYVTLRIREWHQENQQKTRLMLGAAMVVAAAVILVSIVIIPGTG